MPEYFDKYKTFERIQTNTTIDKPVLILWKCTVVELGSGFVFLLAGIYTIATSWLLSLLFFGLAAFVPMTMRWMREQLPRNTFIHLFWFLGLMGNSLPKHVQRPSKFYMGP